MYDVRLIILAAGWTFLGYVTYKVAISKNENKLYNPFEILDINMVSIVTIRYALVSEGSAGNVSKRYQIALQKAVEEIASTICFRSISRLIPFHSHPDKVKLGLNDTVEAVQARFVEITKAYKACVPNTRPSCHS